MNEDESYHYNGVIRIEKQTNLSDIVESLDQLTEITKETNKILKKIVEALNEDEESLG